MKTQKQIITKPPKPITFALPKYGYEVIEIKVGEEIKDQITISKDGMQMPCPYQPPITVQNRLTDQLGYQRSACNNFCPHFQFKELKKAGEEKLYKAIQLTCGCVPI